jgi:DNA-binding GntR family transcriptional regulator
MPSTVASHRAILDGLRGRDPDAAEAAVSRHLRNGERVMQRALGRLTARGSAPTAAAG